MLEAERRKFAELAVETSDQELERANEHALGEVLIDLHLPTPQPAVLAVGRMETDSLIGYHQTLTPEQLTLVNHDQSIAAELEQHGIHVDQSTGHLADIHDGGQSTVLLTSVFDRAFRAQGGALRPAYFAAALLTELRRVTQADGRVIIAGTDNRYLPIAPMVGLERMSTTETAESHAPVASILSEPTSTVDVFKPCEPVLDESTRQILQAIDLPINNQLFATIQAVPDLFVERLQEGNLSVADTQIEKMTARCSELDIYIASITTGTQQMEHMLTKTDVTNRVSVLRSEQLTILLETQRVVLPALIEVKTHVEKILDAMAEMRRSSDKLEQGRLATIIDGEVDANAKVHRKLHDAIKQVGDLPLYNAYRGNTSEDKRRKTV